MKRFFLLSMVALSAVSAPAVETGRWGAGLQGSYSSPMAGLANWFKPAPNYAISLGQQFNQNWFLEGMVEHSAFDRENLSGYAAGKLELSLAHTAAMFSGRYTISRIRAIQPYLHFAAGILHWKGLRGEVAANPAIGLPHIDEKALQEYNWSFRGGAGVEFLVTPALSLDLFACYRLVIGDLYPTMQPYIELEGVSGFQTLNAGLGLRYYF